MRLRSLATICLLFVSVTPVPATANSGYTLHYITSHEGLPDTSVRAIAQDATGLIWVGTESGLYRFDGRIFDHFEAPFGHGVVNTIQTDSRGRLWVSWYTRPTTVLNPRTREWTTVDVIPPRILPLGFLEDPAGRIWLSDGTGLYEFNEATKTAEQVLSLDYDPLLVVSQDLVWFDDLVWLADDRRLLAWDPLVRTVRVSESPTDEPAQGLQIQGDSLWICYRNSVYRRHKDEVARLYYQNRGIEIRSCGHDGAGVLWIGTAQDGALRVISPETVQHFGHDPADVHTIASNEVNRIFTDSNGTVWYLSPGSAGYFGVNGFSNYHHDSSGKRAVYRNLSGLLIFEDRSGVIWLGTNGDGLARLSRYASKFSSAIPPSGDTRARSPATDAAGNVWVGMVQNGLFRWNPTSGVWRHYEADPGNAGALPTAAVRSLLVSSSGSVYAGSDVAAISRYLPATDSWHRIELGSYQPVFNLLEMPDGRILIGRQEKVTVYSPDSGTLEHFPMEGIAHVRATTPASSGEFWLGTHQGPGLVKFDAEMGVLRSWPNLLGDYNVFALYEDSAGILWIGTWGQGLIRFDPATEQLASLFDPQRLPDHTIVGILPGIGDDVWISSSEGLARIENCVTATVHCDARVTRFNEADGLSNHWFNADSSYRSDDGGLYFGGPNGVDFFHPAQFQENSDTPEVVVVDALLNGSPLIFDDSAARQVFRLPHRFGEVQIRFATTDFHNPEKNRYRFRLNPYDDWIAVEGAGQLAFRNLNAGVHTLEIEGSNNDGVWSAKPIYITLDVARPAYLSWPMICIYLTVTSAVIGTVILQRQRRARAYTAMLEKEVESRTEDLYKANQAMAEFYANVSHEVRTPLALIVSATDRLRGAATKEESTAVISAIQRHAQVLSRYVDSLITISQIKSTPEVKRTTENIRAFIRSLITDFRPLAGKREVTITDGDPADIFVRSQPNGLNTIFSNLLVNAIRHTDEDGTIHFTVERSDSNCLVLIEDDGPGIPEEHRESVFGRGVLYSDYGGHGIGLHLVRQTVLALGGSIDVDVSKLGGAGFTVTLPLADDLLADRPPAEALPGHALELPEIEEGRLQRSNDSAGDSILIVEDQDELRRNMGELLASRFRVIEASGVQEAIDLAATEIPDIVLCDVMLPDGSGFDVSRRVKENSNTDHVPVVMLTALADEESRLEGLNSRADAYLTKPCRQDVLEKTLDNLLLDRRNLQREAAIRAWNSNGQPPATTRQSEWSFGSRFMAALSTHYEDSANGVDVIADSLAMSRRALERKTRHFFNRTPNELLTEFRLQQAAQLLSRGLRIADVFGAVGFGSQSHFGQLFRKRFGCTPKKYAKR